MARKIPLIGSASVISQGGYQSELIAQLLFSQWGTVVATPNPQDHGIDLHCTITEKVGKRAWAKSPYTVQVKSNMDAWIFKGEQSIRWLIDHPLPLFLCVVDKKTLRISIYETSARFVAWCSDRYDEIALKPIKYDPKRPRKPPEPEIALSDPIIDVSLEEIKNEVFVRELKTTLEFWINEDNRNLALRRASLMRCFQRRAYTPNTVQGADSSHLELGRMNVSENEIRKGIATMAEALDCIGSQLYDKDRTEEQQMLATKICILFRQVFKMYSELMPRIDESRSIFIDFGKRFGLDLSETFPAMDKLDVMVEKKLNELKGKANKKAP